MTRETYTSLTHELNAKHIQLVKDLLVIHRRLKDRFFPDDYMSGETLLLERLYLVETLSAVDPHDNETLYKLFLKEDGKLRDQYDKINFVGKL